MKSIIFWDMTPRSALSCSRRFGGTYRLHLQGRRIVQQTSKQAGGNESISIWFTMHYIIINYTCEIYYDLF
jgi:hypothetical protein